MTGQRFALTIACRANGRLTVSASSIAPAVIARGAYVCRNGHATARLSLRRIDVRRLAALGGSVATATVREEGRAARLSFTLEAGRGGPSYWSDGGLVCDLLGAYEPYLVAPNYTSTPSAVIDVRPWIAWYTPVTGWRWLGTAGANASSWYQWTATPTGVQQWETPAGASNRWTWAPIHVPAGQQTFAIAAFEIVYWYARPRYQWRYALSGAAGGPLTNYCSYP